MKLTEYEVQNAKLIELEKKYNGLKKEKKNDEVEVWKAKYH